ncbi:MAG: gliding motility-associated ABC transporter substrate-binding protein GldG [bacterium]
MTRRRIHMKSWLLPLLVIVGVNVLSYFFHAGIDLTAEKRFTLSESSRKLVSDIKDPFTLTVYLEGDMPAGFKRLANAAEDMGSSFNALSVGKFVVEFERPGEGLNDSLKAVLFDSLQRMGINPTNVKAQQKKGEQTEQTLVFPGAILTGPKGQVGIDFLEGQSNLNGLESLNNAEALMEYKIAKALVMLQRDTLPAIAYLTGNGEPLDLSVYDLIEGVLRRDYRVAVLPIDSVSFIPKDFSAIVIAKPVSAFSKIQKLKIDQYIMGGGKVLWAMDNLFASMDSLQRSSGSFIAFDLGLDLDEQLFKYGVRINRDLVQDLECDKVPSVIGSIGDKPQIELLPWPYSPLLSNIGGHPISRNLDVVLSSFPQSIDTVASPGISKHLLLASSLYSRSLQTPAIVEWRSIKNEEDLNLFNRPNIPVAVLLEGKFSSAFTNRLSKTELETLMTLDGPFKTQCIEPNQMIVISDADILLNPVSEQDGPLRMGTNAYTRQQFANRDFVANCLFYLTGGEGIMEARTKTFRLRLLDKEKIEQDAGFWKALNVLLPLLLPVIIFFLYSFFRKRQFAYRS